jgi:hypothetical protein
MIPPGRNEVSLAGVVPLWCTYQEGDLTLMVTPAGDYVTGVALGGVDARLANGAEVERIGEQLRSFVGGLDDGAKLLFLCRVKEGDPVAVAQYGHATAEANPSALAAYTQGRVEWLAQQAVRRTELYLFFSVDDSGGRMARGNLGQGLVFRPAAAKEAHEKAVERLSRFRDRLVARLGSCNVGCRHLAVDEVRQLYFELLNPTLCKTRTAPKVELRESIWDERVLAEHPHLREYTEAEQLCLEDVNVQRGHFRQGDVLRRVVTLKQLPEAGTSYFSAQNLQRIAVDGKPMGYTLAVGVHVENQGVAKWKLNTRHRLVQAVRTALPFMSEESASSQAENAAVQDSILSLFQEMTDQSTKVCSLSASLLFDAPTLQELDRRTEAVRSAFSEAGNSQFLLEDVSQLQAFLGMLPASGAYAFRKKGCTSRNAADFLPIYTPWTGGETGSLQLTPDNEFFHYRLFDRSFGVNAFHGIVCADTGSGKSFTVGMLALDALAAGVDAVLVDNGRSWQRLTQLMGGVHIPVDLDTSISPFVSYEGAADEEGMPDRDVVAQAVNFIEVCVTDHAFTAFDVPSRDFLGKAIRRCYVERFRSRPTEKPLMGDFRDYLMIAANAPGAHAADKQLAADLHRRLAAFCDPDGVYFKFLNRPSKLRFDTRLLTFEMERVSRDARTKKIAMAAVMEAISSRVTAKVKRPTMVALDEAHEMLGDDDSTVRFIAGAYAKMRKYETAMWSISQKFETFQACKASHVIIGNSQIKMFLYHSSGHGALERHFNLSAQSSAAFRGLQRNPGRYSDVFLMYGDRNAVVRMAPHPFAYWTLTTDRRDLNLLEQSRASNPAWSEVDVLRALAKHYPHGASAGRVARPKAA